MVAICMIDGRWEKRKQNRDEERKSVRTDNLKGVARLLIFVTLPVPKVIKSMYILMHDL